MNAKAKPVRGPSVRATMADQRRRIVLPPVCPPGSPVVIETLDPYTFIVTRPRPNRKFKTVVFPVNAKEDTTQGGEAKQQAKWEKAVADYCWQNAPEPPEE